MKELTEIVGAWETLCAAGQETLLATVVGVSGSTYRRPGARMLLTSERRVAGSVSGGCLEGDILQKAWWRTREGAVVVTYDSTDEDEVVWGFGLGCNGVVQVLLERVTPRFPGPLKLLEAVLRERRSGVVATVVSVKGVGERLLLMPDGSVESNIGSAALAASIEADARVTEKEGQSRTETYPVSDGNAVTVLLEPILPPAPLVIFGANFDAGPLVRLAKELGRYVTVVDTRAARARPERFPWADRVIACPAEAAVDSLEVDARTAAVIMTHNYLDDRRILRMLLESPAGYIGQLGPRARTERLLAEIRDDGLPITEGHRRRLHGPVGLDLGADTPEEIALSIIAEVQAVQAGREGGHLRERRDPLHLRPTHAILVPEQGTKLASCLVL